MGNTPNIRFKGFTDDWEQRKWIDTVDISTEMVDPTTGEYDDMPHIAPGNIEPFTGRILDNVKTVKEEQLISGKFRFRPNDVVYGKINPQLGKYFYASIDGLTSADAYVFNGKNGITQKFLYSVLQTKDFFKYSISVSKRSGMPKINRDELNAYSFCVPKEEEQEKIGDFLLGIDNLITLHQRKCDETKKLKKFMLQKMFPKKDANKPEIRFAGFTDDWEQRKLDEVVDFLDTQRKPLEGSKRVSGPYPYYGASGIVDYVEEYLFDEELILLSEDGANITDRNYPVCFLASGKYWVNNHAHVLKAKRGYENNFICNSMERKDFTPFNTGMAMPKLNQEVCRNIPILCPEYAEQKKIGDYFRNLDRLITLHQRKCDELKEFKKYMLQNMFPQKG